MKQSTAEQLVRARLWEDPVAAVDRAIREQGAAKTTSRGSSLAKRLGPLRHAIAQRVHRGEQLTVLLITTTGAAMSRVRNRAFAIGMPSARLWSRLLCAGRRGSSVLRALGTGQHSSGLPYEWYRLRKTRVCGAAGSRADSILIVWLPDEAVTAGFFATLTSLSQGLVCREDSNECLLNGAKPFSYAWIRPYSKPSLSRSSVRAAHRPIGRFSMKPVH